MGFFKFKKKDSDLPDLGSLDSLPKDDLDKDLFGANPPPGLLDHKDDLSMDLDVPPPPPGTTSPVPPPVQQAEDQPPFDFNFPEMQKEQSNEPVEESLAMPDLEMPPDIPEFPEAPLRPEPPRPELQMEPPQVIQVSRPEAPRPVVKIEMPQSPRSAPIQQAQPLGPLYLRLDSFGNMMAEFSALTDLFSTVKSHESSLDGLNRKQEHLFGKWHTTMCDMQKQLDEIDAELFTG